MKTLIKLLAAATLALAMPAFAGSQTAVPPRADNPHQPSLQSCPAPDGPIHLSQVSQADCCKGHKGVCGCRAGKIVCCDNTVSLNCTCHGDSGLEN